MATNSEKITSFKELTDRLPTEHISDEDFAVGTKKMNERMEKLHEEHSIRMDNAKRSASQVWVH